MIVTVWWEDQRQRALPRQFGPHTLLVACVADELDANVRFVGEIMRSIPLKGAGNVRRELMETAPNLGAGPLFVVLDRDKVIELWPADKRPSDCMQGISRQIRSEAPGGYDLVFLQRNIETLVHACAAALREPTPTAKPKPEVRDRLLHRVAWEARQVRDQVRENVVDFDRLVRRVAALVLQAQAKHELSKG